MPPVALRAETRGQAARYNYEKQATFAAVFCCIVASSGGLLFGYDLGVAGGVTAMENFQRLFFHSVWEREYGPEKFVASSPYCQFDSQTLQLFQSSLYIAAFFSSIIGSYVGKLKGRKMCMILAGICYLIGSGLTAGAAAKSSGLAMLIIGRLSLGAGVGFGNSSVTIYSSEMAPPKHRGMLNLFFQWCTTIGIIIAQLINYGTETYYANGWRISLAIAAVPGFIILIGGLLLPETPSFLLSKNRYDEARAVLQRIRGQQDVEMEYQDILVNTRMDAQVRHPMLALFKPCYRPYLIISVFIAVVQQLTGINAIMFYAPQLFSTFGSARKAALLNTVIIGAVNVASTVVAIVGVDRFGRRGLLIFGGCAMIVCEIIVGVCLGYFFNHDHGHLTDRVSHGILAVICIYVANFAWSWGPLGWLVPAEIQPAEIRTAGMSMATCANMLFTFVIGQCFLTMLCHMKYGVFLFFAGCCIVGVVFIAALLPECKGLHVEEVYEKFTTHWFWKRYPAPPRPTLPELTKGEMAHIDPKVAEINPKL